MQVSHLKNQKLIKKYPFLQQILEWPFEPLDGEKGTGVNDLTIKIQKADGDLLFQYADNFGCGDNSFIASTKHRRQNQVMKRAEYLLAIDSKGWIINQVDWPKTSEEKRGAPALYAKSIFQKEGTGLYNDIQYLVWVRVEAWHDETQDDELSNRFGKFRERIMTVTIYSKPACGFFELERSSVMMKHLMLTSTVVMEGCIREDREMFIISGRLDELCQFFQEEVFYKGMKKVLDEGNVRGASGQFGPVKVLCAEMLGYDRVMLQDDKSWISMQRRPDAESLYVLGMYGTLPQLRNLVKTVIQYWNNQPEARATFKPDRVSVI